jgi:hypothetical protein
LPADEKVWPGYEGFMPDKPNDAIALYDTGGTSTARSMVTGTRSDKPGVQVKVRSTDRSKAWKKIESIRNYLNGTVKRTAATIGSDSYTIHSVTQVGTIADLGTEPEGNRSEFTLNVRVTIS